jgi:osmotically-inducible protein OsmY
MKMYNMIFILVLPLVLGACTPLGLATGIGATAGVAAAQEGGISAAANDARIQFEINELWFRNDVEMFRKLDLTINEGRVLITGIVQDPEARVEAVRLAWQPKGVKQVINEIRVAQSEGITGFAKDTWITTRLRTAITFDKNISSINYSIDTVAGTVYLMGFAQNQLELNRVTETARTIPGVKGVVSYVKLVGSTPPSATGAYGAQGQDLTYSSPSSLAQYPAQTSPPPGQPLVIRPEPSVAGMYGLPPSASVPTGNPGRHGIETEVLR